MSKLQQPGGISMEQSTHSALDYSGCSKTALFCTVCCVYQFDISALPVQQWLECNYLVKIHCRAFFSVYHRTLEFASDALYSEL